MTFSKTHILPVVLITLLMGAASAVAAPEDADDRPPHPPRAGHFFMEADTDGDGVVTKAEIEAMKRTHFDRIDANKDGFATFEEIESAREMRRKEREGGHFSRLDTDGDGQVSFAEFATPRDKFWQCADKNADGGLSKRELKQARKCGPDRGERKEPH